HLRLSNLESGTRIVWIDKKTYRGNGGHYLVQQLEPLRPQHGVERAHARDVATRSIKASHKAEFDRVFTYHDDDWDDRCCGLGRARGAAAAGEYHRHLTADQIGRQRGQSIVVTLRPTVFDHDILAIDVAGFAERLAKRGNVERGINC